MAVYTRLDRQDIEAFIAPYHLGRLLDYQGITQGVENTNYDIRTQRGRFVLTVFEKRVDPDQLPAIFDFMQACHKHGVPCADIVESDHGRLGRIKGKPACLATFLPGRDVEQAALTPVHCRLVGQVLGRMHLAGEQEPTSLGATVLCCKTWRDLIAQTGEGFFASLYPQLIAALDDFDRNWPDHLPSGAVHADLFPDNVLFDGEQIGGAIDFYFAHENLFVYDYAVTMISWCVDADGDIDQQLYQAFEEGYKGIRGLSEVEQDTLPMMLKAACIRFLATRAYDWTHTPDNAQIVKKDPQEYINKFIKSGEWL